MPMPELRFPSVAEYRSGSRGDATEIIIPLRKEASRLFHLHCRKTKLENQLKTPSLALLNQLYRAHTRCVLLMIDRDDLSAEAALEKVSES